MARMPNVQWQGEKSPRNRMTRYDIVCVHTIVGYAPAHAAHFSTKANGQIIQSRDTLYRSGANLNGNHRVIAIENEDHGPAFGSWNTRNGHAVPALTAAQVEANAKILAWAHKTHGVPLQMCPNSRPTSRGLGYHRQGIDGNWSGYKYGGRVSGGEVWTSSRGKVCPGDRRIDQLPQILARAKQIAGGSSSTPSPGDPLMAISGNESQVLAKIADAVLDRVLDKVDPNSGSTPRMRVKNMLRHAHYRGNQISVHQLPEMVATQERIESKVEALLGGGHDEVLSRIAANHAETLAALTASAERETAQLELIEEALSGERDASDTLRALRDLIDTAVGDGADPDDDGEA